MCVYANAQSCMGWKESACALVWARTRVCMVCVCLCVCVCVCVFACVCLRACVWLRACRERACVRACVRAYLRAMGFPHSCVRSCGHLFGRMRARVRACGTCIWEGRGVPAARARSKSGLFGPVKETSTAAPMHSFNACAAAMPCPCPVGAWATRWRGVGLLVCRGRVACVRCRAPCPGGAPCAWCDGTEESPAKLPTPRRTPRRKTKPRIETAG